MSKEVVEMIVSNMIDNARNHGATSLSLKPVVNNGLIELSISDNGDGISKANAKKIFDPFFYHPTRAGGDRHRPWHCQIPAGESQRLHSS